MNYPEPPEGVAIFTPTTMDMGISDPYARHYNPPRPAHDYATPMGYETSAVGPSQYVDAPYHHYMPGRSPPPAYADEGDLTAPGSTLSTASASSSILGSPLSHHGQPSHAPDWAAPQQLGMSPCIVDSSTEYYHTTSGLEYPLPGTALDGFGPAFDYSTAGKPPCTGKPGCVDPTLTIHPEARPMIISGYEGYPASAALPTSTYPRSPAYSATSQLRAGSLSPSFPAPGIYHPHYSQFPPPPTKGHVRRPSLASYNSAYSGEQPYSGDESKEKQRCPHADCGKAFKDLKAHMLTHQTERPEKCPIATCDYHIKGFARKYDKNRHTLTHYKGTMVCGFCPGPGSAAEKSFNRADVFKRHLTAVHGVEQTPPNSRRKAAALGGAASTAGGEAGNVTGYAADATGKCSTCSQTFRNAQEFYEHLDDCVLRIVQQEDPAEAINARRLAEVENDRNVRSTLEKNNLPLETIKTEALDEAGDEDDEAMLDDEEPAGAPADSKSGRRLGSSPTAKCRVSPNGAVQKSRGTAPSRVGRPAAPSGAGVAAPSAAAAAAAGNKATRKGGAGRREFPSSWGFDKSQMTMKKRVMAVFDGPRRLAKDDLAMSTEHEVRVQLANGQSYVTDLDVQTLRRAEGFLGAPAADASAWSPERAAGVDFERTLDFSVAVGEGA